MTDVSGAPVGIDSVVSISVAGGISGVVKSNPDNKSNADLGTGFDSVSSKRIS